MNKHKFLNAVLRLLQTVWIAFVVTVSVQVNDPILWSITYLLVGQWVLGMLDYSSWVFQTRPNMTMYQRFRDVIVDTVLVPLVLYRCCHYYYFARMKNPNSRSYLKVMRDAGKEAGLSEFACLMLAGKAVYDQGRAGRQCVRGMERYYLQNQHLIDEAVHEGRLRMQLIQPGRRYGSLTFVRFDHFDKPATGLFDCDCGTRMSYSLEDVKSGKVTSCGCNKGTLEV